MGLTAMKSKETHLTELHELQTQRELAISRQQRRTVAKAVANANGRADGMGTPGKLETEDVILLMEMAGWRCLYCGQPDRPKLGLRGVMSIDHVIPFIAGGDNLLSNVVPCCYSCNARKRHSDLDSALERLGVDAERFMARWNVLRGKLGLEPITLSDVLGATYRPKRSK